MNANTCPECRHANHGGYPCLNMASDNDCACTSPSRQRSALSSPPADDVREALARAVEAAWGDPRWDGETLRPIDRKIADAILAEFEVRPYGTVTDTERLEYTVAAVSENGTITQLADYTTVVRDHLKADLELYRIEEERAMGSPERIIIAQRPIPKWVRS